MEFLYGCEPDNDDTDDDGILDGEEVIPGVDGFITNPTDDDTDGDFLPVEGFIEKPVNPQQLLNKIKQLLQKINK